MTAFEIVLMVYSLIATYFYWDANRDFWIMVGYFDRLEASFKSLHESFQKLHDRKESTK
jgi:hypothetical protein